MIITPPCFSFLVLTARPKRATAHVNFQPHISKSTHMQLLYQHLLALFHSYYHHPFIYIVYIYTHFFSILHPHPSPLSISNSRSCSTYLLTWNHLVNLWWPCRMTHFFKVYHHGQCQWPQTADGGLPLTLLQTARVVLPPTLNFVTTTITVYLNRGSSARGAGGTGLEVGPSGMSLLVAVVVRAVDQGLPKGLRGL